MAGNLRSLSAGSLVRRLLRSADAAKARLVPLGNSGRRPNSFRPGLVRRIRIGPPPKTSPRLRPLPFALYGRPHRQQ